MKISRPWLEGLLAALPLLPGIAAGGVLYAVTAVDSGMPPWTVVTTSLLVATGTAQFIALDLLDRGMAWWLIVLIGLAINLRFAVYSLHLSPLASNWPIPRRLAYYGLMTDEGYALTISRQDEGEHNPRNLLVWSSGLMLVVWSAWLLGTVLGAVTGKALPSGPALDMAVPLTLLSVLALMISSSRHLRVAVVAGMVAVLLRDAPFGMGLISGMAAGAGMGMLGDQAVGGSS